MNDILFILKEYNGVLSMLATIIVAFLTYFNLRIANKSLKEMKATRIEENRPIVILTLKKSNPRNDYFELEIKNFGKTYAKNINFTLTPSIDHISIIDHENLHLAPTQNIVDTFAFDETDIYGQTYNVSIEYFDSLNRKYTDSYSINLSYYESLNYVDITPPKSNSEEILESIETNISTINRTFSRLMKTPLEEISSTVECHNLDDLL